MKVCNQLQVIDKKDQHRPKEVLDHFKYLLCGAYFACWITIPIAAVMGVLTFPTIFNTTLSSAILYALEATNWRFVLILMVLQLQIHSIHQGRNSHIQEA